jgi:hypothetical protein
VSDYPNRAGYKTGGASALAANKITDNGLRHTLRLAVMRLFDSRDDWTPDEAAERLGQHPADIRPRFSELILAKYDRDGHLIQPAYLWKTEVMRFSSRGNPQHVYEKLRGDWW